MRITTINILITTARSNKVATTLAMQDFSQLKKDYGKEQADVKSPQSTISKFY
jgi:type IV secretory pathway TraG/TraD family ATPase VirD4